MSPFTIYNKEYYDIVIIVLLSLAYYFGALYIYIKKKMWYDCQWDNSPQETKITQNLTTLVNQQTRNNFTYTLLYFSRKGRFKRYLRSYFSFYILLKKFLLIRKQRLWITKMKFIWSHHDLVEWYGI